MGNRPLGHIRSVSCGSAATQAWAKLLCASAHWRSNIGSRLDTGPVGTRSPISRSDRFSIFSARHLYVHDRTKRGRDTIAKRVKFEAAECRRRRGRRVIGTSRRARLEVFILRERLRDQQGAYYMAVRVLSPCCRWPGMETPSGRSRPQQCRVDAAAQNDREEQQPDTFGYVFHIQSLLNWPGAYQPLPRQSA